MNPDDGREPMRAMNNGSTCPAWLASLRENNDEAWRLIDRTFGGLIRNQMQSFELQPADRDEVVSDVLAKLLVGLPTYDRTKGRFRDWLATLTRHAAIDHYRRSRRQPWYVDEERLRGLCERVGDGGVAALENLDDVVNKLLAEVKRRHLATDKMIQVYLLVHRENMPVAAAAAQTGLSEKSVEVYASRVKGSLQEVAREMFD